MTEMQSTACFTPSAADGLGFPISLLRQQWSIGISTFSPPKLCPQSDFPKYVAPLTLSKKYCAAIVLIEPGFGKKPGFLILRHRGHGTAVSGL